MKKSYIKPNIKVLTQRLELMLFDGTEDTGDPSDWQSLDPDDPQDPHFQGKSGNVWYDGEF